MSNPKKAARLKTLIELLEPHDPLFEVVYLLHEDQVAAELEALNAEMHRRNRPRITTYALCCGYLNQQDKVRKLAIGVRDAGHLLFAFAGTTALQGGAA
jgi:hypothetical protein